MDLPSATGAQSQHHQKRVHHDNQQQVSACRPYDQSQIQDYAACYLYAQPYALRQQFYPYHPNFAYDYRNAIAAVNAYQEGGQVEKQLQQELQTSYEFPPGLEPSAAAAAAVAAAMSALSQVSQFAGKMDACEQALMEMPEQLWSNEACIQIDSFQPSVGKLPWRRGRGDEPFMDNRGCFDQHHRWSDTEATDGPGRERIGKSRRRHLQRNVSDVTLVSYEPGPHKEPQSEDTLAIESTAAGATDFAGAPTTSLGQQRRTLQTARCDLCKVYCNTREILQNHKNGKRHKKNMRKLKEFKDSENILSKSQQASGQPGSVLGFGESNRSSIGDLPKTTITKDANKTEEQTMLTEDRAEVPTVGLTETAARRLRMDSSFEYQQHPSEQKVQGNSGSRGWNLLKQSQSVSRSGAPKVQPKYCALCRVTCDTQFVLESHLAGRRHTSRVKKPKGSRGKYMAVGLHALYMPDALQTGLGAGAQQESQIEGQKNPLGGQQAVLVGPAGQDAAIEDAVHKSDGNAPLAIHNKCSIVIDNDTTTV